MDVASQAWTPAEHALWSRIEAHAFEDAGVTLDLTRRLARDMGWPLATARAAIVEYKRFCFLAMVSADGPVTPSEEVDAVWHLHLTYTRDYWERWCGAALGRRLHHDPTEGGPAEATRYRAQYAQTLALYERWFGAPPAAFWPGTAQRFAARPRFRHVDGARVLVLPRPRLPRVPLVAGLLAGVLSVVGGGAASAQEVGPGTTSNPLDWSGTPFLQLYIALLVAALLAATFLNRRTRSNGGAADGGNLDPVAIAYLAGGRSRAADALLLEMAVAGRARLDALEIWLDQDARDVPDRLQPYGSLPPGRYSRAQLQDIFADSARAIAIRADLVQRQLLLSSRRRHATMAATLMPIAPVLCLGVAKLAVGLSRDRPVGYLVVLLVLSAFVTIRLLLRGSQTTREGARLVRGLRRGDARAVRAPVRGELPLAFAVLGATALASSDYAAYAKQIPAASRSEGCGGGADGGGGGCGGGGCGGCSG